MTFVSFQTKDTLHYQTLQLNMQLQFHRDSLAEKIHMFVGSFPLKRSTIAQLSVDFALYLLKQIPSHIVIVEKSITRYFG